MDNMNAAIQRQRRNLILMSTLIIIVSCILFFDRDAELAGESLLGLIKINGLSHPEDITFLLLLLFLVFFIYRYYQHYNEDKETIDDFIVNDYLRYAKDKYKHKKIKEDKNLTDYNRCEPRSAKRGASIPR